MWWVLLVSLCAAMGWANLSFAQSAAPRILNPAEELSDFDPRGILRWTSVAGADTYEVLVFDDVELKHHAKLCRINVIFNTFSTPLTRSWLISALSLARKRRRVCRVAAIQMPNCPRSGKRSTRRRSAVRRDRSRASD